MEIIKYPKRQDCHYKLTKGSSNESSINLSADIFEFLIPNGMKKGEVLSIAEFAGIMGAKKTSELIPLCHPLLLTDVQVSAKLIKN